VPPIGFAHRGARADAPENTLEAFTLARRLGAPGLESDVWITADGEAVLDHDGVVRVGVRRRQIAELRRRDLPRTSRPWPSSTRCAAPTPSSPST
jgi:glycerophosphoryl diester phosphodiesterase